MKNKRVVVTGMGAITPIGNNISEYWLGLINGISGAESIKRFNVDNFNIYRIYYIFFNQKV